MLSNKKLPSKNLQSWATKKNITTDPEDKNTTDIIMSVLVVCKSQLLKQKGEEP